MIHVTAGKYSRSSSEAHWKDLKPHLDEVSKEGRCSVAIIIADSGPDWNTASLLNAIFFIRLHELYYYTCTLFFEAHIVKKIHSVEDLTDHCCRIAIRWCPHIDIIKPFIHICLHAWKNDVPNYNTCIIISNAFLCMILYVLRFWLMLCTLLISLYSIFVLHFPFIRLHYRSFAF